MVEEDGNAETRRRKLVEKRRLKGIGRRIAARRKKTGTPQRVLAGRTGISVVSLSQIEGGHQEPKISTLIRLADELGTTVQVLLGEALPFDSFHPTLRRALEQFFLELAPVNQLLCAEDS